MVDRTILLILLTYSFSFVFFFADIPQMQPPRFTSTSSGSSTVNEDRIKIFQCHALGKFNWIEIVYSWVWPNKRLGLVFLHVCETRIITAKDEDEETETEEQCGFCCILFRFSILFFLLLVSIRLWWRREVVLEDFYDLRE